MKVYKTISWFKWIVAISILQSTVPTAAGTPQDVEEKLPIKFHTAHFDYEDGAIILHIDNEDGTEEVQIAELGPAVIPDESPKVHVAGANLTLSWPDFGSLTCRYVKHASGIEYKMDWETISDYFILHDKYLLPGSHWYGVAQIRTQEWPIEKWVRSEKPFVAGDSFKDAYGGVQDRYWLSSRGVAIYVHHDVPLFITMNADQDGRIGLISKWNSPYANINNKNVKLTYQIFISSDVRTAHELATGEVFRNPIDIPDELIFRSPIWSTWARYKRDIDQNRVLEFAEEIKENGFKAAQIEIDDDWTPRYGDMEFDSDKFPDPEEMMRILKADGHRVTVWVHPFCSVFSSASYEPYWLDISYFPGYTIWWNGVGKILDVTNAESVEWFQASMLNLKERYNLTSFKFDAGEINWLPYGATPEVPWENPNEYTTRFTEMCYQCDMDPRALEVRVGVQTQHLPIFVRMMDKDSNWGYNNGLKSLIPHALTFSILGYPFILPDMVGGNAYSASGIIGSSSELPEKELFIRWLQANVFLPSLQYSISPWQYDKETLDICKDFTNLHEVYADKIIALAKNSTLTGAPIIRPLWWIAPNDETAQIIDDQFLLGDDLLVAPVLVKGARKRNIYLPNGTWFDELRKRELQGGQWYNNSKAELDELPYFTKVSTLQDDSHFGSGEEL